LRGSKRFIEACDSLRSQASTGLRLSNVAQQARIAETVVLDRHSGVTEARPLRYAGTCFVFGRDLVERPLRRRAAAHLQVGERH
jgi:hypothetical protein